MALNPFAPSFIPMRSDPVGCGLLIFDADSYRVMSRFHYMRSLEHTFQLSNPSISTYRKIVCCSVMNPHYETYQLLAVDAGYELMSHESEVKLAMIRGLYTYTHVYIMTTRSVFNLYLHQLLSRNVLIYLIRSPASSFTKRLRSVITGQSHIILLPDTVKRVLYQTPFYRPEYYHWLLNDS